MVGKKSSSEAQIRAHKKYMENFVEVKAHAKKQEESATSFINRAIDETMKRDNDSFDNV